MEEGPGMLVEPIRHWLPAHTEREALALCDDLRSYQGYRTVWLDRDGRVWHAEPEVDLPEGATYLGTFFRPTPDAMLDTIAAALPLSAAS
jgi:hypothetical protein